MKTDLVIALLLMHAHQGLCSSPRQPTLVPENGTDTEVNDDEHPCKRPCRSNERPMVCHYTFKIEHYQSLSKACFDCPSNPDDCKRPNCIPGDGSRRPVAVVNRQVPGPMVEVCQGDDIVVDVENLLVGESTTIHWHGHHQRATPYMDGVPFITQCPIQPSTTFRYHFKAVHGGTHFWHSHTGFQRADGAFGAFIVRTPAEQDPHAGLYDFDLSSHIMIALDWGPESGIGKFVAHHHSNGDNKPATLLINGLGRFEHRDNHNNTIFTPAERFVVAKGYRYRFRIINAGFLNCPIEVSIDKHTLTVISSDGKDFVPVQVESVVTYAGERFDFIVNTNQERGLYWIRFRGLMDCDARFKSAHQVAVLQYEGASHTEIPEGNPNYNAAHKEGIQLNAVNVSPGETNSINVVELESLDPWDPSLKKVADYQFIVSYDFYRIDNPHFHKPGLYGFHSVPDAKQQLLTPQLNHISMKLLASPLLPARDYIDTSSFCNRSTLNHCETNYCECPHVLQVALNSVVELIVVDKGVVYDANHPFHLHGHSFRVVGMERVAKEVSEDTIRRLDESGKIKRNLVNPPIKDTVTVPDGGYTVLRFQANNPGFWLFHCHLEFHIEIGMALVLKVGKNSEMLPVPPNFPQCGNYQPELNLPIDQRRHRGHLRSWVLSNRFH